MGNIRLIDGIIIVIYFVLMAALGVVGYKKNETSEDYFVAGKKLGTFSLAAMWLSSWIGGSSIVGTSTDAYNLGVCGGWYVVILSFGCAIFGLTFSKMVNRLGNKLHNITYPALITSRYDSRSGVVVVICCFLANLAFLASQLVAMGSMLTTITGWSTSTCFLVSTAITVAYSAIGGLLAITYTTWIQFILIVLGTVVLGIPLAGRAMGGFGQLQTLPPEWFDLGRAGWPTTIALAVSSIFSFFTSMDSYTRCFAAKSAKASRNGALWAAFAILFIALGATVIGLAARVLMPELPAGSSAYAALVASYFPAGISGLVLVGVFAAIMSTGVVCINCCAANISVDIYKDLIRPETPDRKIKLLGMLSSVIVGVVGAMLAWWKYNVIQLLLLAFTFQASSLFFPTVLGMFWKKPTANASFVSMAVSLLVVLLWMVGDGLGWGGVFTLDAVWPGLVSSALVYVLMSVFGKQSPEDIKRAERFCTDSPLPEENYVLDK